MTTQDLRLRVKAERKRRRLTQREVAEEVGLSLRAYQMFETGRSTPQPDNMTAILAFMELDGDGNDLSAEDGECPTCGRELWPDLVQTFLDTMGAYLMSLSESDRKRAVHVVTGQIFKRHH